MVRSNTIHFEQSCSDVISLKGIIMAKTNNAVPAKGSKTKTLPKGAMAAKGLDQTKLVVPDELLAPEAEQMRRAGDAQANALVQNDAIASMVATLTTPVAAPVSAPTQTAEQLAAYKAKLAELNKEFGLPETANIKVKAPKAATNQKNGITMPNEGTDSRKIWDTASRLSKENNLIATVSMIKKDPVIAALNDATVKTQFARWRQYNGIKGRQPTLATPVVHQTVGEYAGIPQIVPTGSAT